MLVNERTLTFSLVPLKTFDRFLLASWLYVSLGLPFILLLFCFLFAFALDKL